MHKNLKSEKQLTAIIVMVLCVVGFLSIYKIVNPMDSVFFPKCPIYSISGILCPGCGSQRAIHHLLNFQLLAALKSNPLLVCFIPYLLIGYVLHALKRKSLSLRKWIDLLYGYQAAYLIITLILVFWLLRNVL